MTKLNQYDVVKITRINEDINPKHNELNERLPQVGDVATIIEIYNVSALIWYHLECVNEDGTTEWEHVFSPSSLECDILQKINK